MPSSGRSILPVISVLLGMLIMLLGIKAARQEAPVFPAATHTVMIASAGHSASFHKISGRRDAHHPAGPGRQKHHRPGGHRAPVAKVAVPSALVLPAKPVAYRQALAAPVVSVFPYEFFREITPPPPKES